MTNITEAVGAGGSNAIHDVAMVQFILKVVKNSRHVPYFGGTYTDRYSGETSRALAAFQTDHGLTPDGGTGGDGGSEIPGVVKPGSATWRALLSALDSAEAQYRSARATEGFGIVYVPMAETRLGESLARIHADKNLQTDFRLKVVQLVQIFFKQSAIAWSMVPTRT
jgi:peptidoglycan hydrolase-like protein with peptidoglycan-binding domain